MKFFAKVILLCGFLFTFNFSASGGDFPIGKSLNPEYDCAIAYNSTDHEYLVVWVELVPSGSGYTLGPVMGQRVSESGVLLESPFSIFERGSSPAAAYNPNKNDYLVTASTGAGIQGQKLDSRGTLLGSPVQLLNKAYWARVVYNSISGNYIIAGAYVVPVSPGSENYRMQIYTRIADAEGQPIGMSFIAQDYPEGKYNSAKSRFAIAYAPITSDKTPTGRCLLATQTPQGILLSMLDGEGMILKLTSPPEYPDVKYRNIPFKAGSHPGGEFNVDVTYGDSSGYNMKGPAFFIVWGDTNNRWNSKAWPGIWGSFVDANKLDYLTTDSLKDNAFPVSAITEHETAEAFSASWEPRTAFNTAAHKFIVVWRETPTNNPLNDTKMNHIRAEKEFEEISMIPNDVVSSANDYCDPYSPAVASSTISPAGLIVWTDNRNSQQTQTDIYGSIYTITPPSSITLIRPNGNENWLSGTEEEILWAKGTFTGSVKIEYSTDGGTTYKEIVNPAPGDSSYMWKAPEVNSAKCLVKVSDASDGDPFDLSDTTFRISSFVKAVTTTSDSGAGSLRQAILDANVFNGTADTIRFNIPKSDSGYNALEGVWYIRPQTELPRIEKNRVVIDGFSQSKFLNEDTNPLGPEIVISGDKAPKEAEGLGIYADSVEVYALTVNRFQNFGIAMLSSENSLISGCYVGTDYSGMKPEGNGNGISLWSYTKKAFIGPVEALGSRGNVVSGNIRSGIILGNYSTNNLITGNYIGVNRLLSDTLGNDRGGIRFESHCDSNLVTDNIISGNAAGVLISGSHNNKILNNFIGTDTSGIVNLGNRNSGIEIANSSKSNLVRRNMIRFNLGFGVLVEGDAAQNTITENNISRHDAPGIRNSDGGNMELTPPVITLKSSALVTGTAGAGYIVELFTDEEDEGEVYIGSDTADSKGNFAIAISDTTKLLKNLTATCTDSAGNTSQFSAVFLTAAAEEYVSGSPVRFDLRQNYPNPFNPVTTIRYELPEDAFVEVTLFDVTGRNVKTLLKEFRQKGYHKLNIDLGHLSSGIYFYRMKAGEFIKTLKMTLIK